MNATHSISRHFVQMPLNAKIWIFQSSRYFTDEERNDIENILDSFMKEWNAHGAALTSAYEILYNRFIVIAVDENYIQASGCSIDSMTRVIKSIEEKYDFGLLNRMLVSYRMEDQIVTLPLSTFKKEVKEGLLSEEITVFHNGLTSLEEFNNQWELPLNESWARSLMSSNLN